MKIFHTKNGKEIVFVQKQDILYLLNHSGIPIPDSIVEKLSIEASDVTDFNKFEFVEFDGNDIVEFFKSTDFIIDYLQYSNFSVEDLMSETIRLQTNAKALCDRYNSMSQKEREQQTAQIHNNHDNIIYMVDAIDDVYCVKTGLKNLCFPDFVQNL